MPLGLVTSDSSLLRHLEAWVGVLIGRERDSCGMGLIQTLAHQSKSIRRSKIRQMCIWLQITIPVSECM